MKDVGVPPSPPPPLPPAETPTMVPREMENINYLLTYDSYVPLYNRFHSGEWIMRVSGGEGALDTPGPLNGTTQVIHSPL